MDLSAYYDQDGDVNMSKAPTNTPQGHEEHKSDPSHTPSHIHTPIPQTTPPHHTPIPQTQAPPEIDYKKMRAEARKKRYPSYFKGRSDPSDDSSRIHTANETNPTGETNGINTTKPLNDHGCFFKPTRLDAKYDVGMASKVGIKMDKDMKTILDALSEDNGKAFASFLKKPQTARKAIHRMLRMKLPSFHQVRILALWHMLRKSHADNVDIPVEDRDAVADYLAEVHDVLEFSFLAETRKRLMTSLDDPSWLWLNFFKRLWTPEMGPDLQTRIRTVGPQRVVAGITPLIQAYHAANRPFRRFGTSSRSGFPSSIARRGATGAKNNDTMDIEIPSLWFRSLFYPMLGGEPKGLFDDTPMSFKETLSTMIA